MTVSKLFRQLTRRPSAVSDHRFIVVYAYRPDGVTPDEGYALRDIINAHRPTDWRFYNPSGFEVLFWLAAPDARANAEALTDALRAFGPSHRLGVGVAEGELMAEFSSDGQLLSWPLGNVISIALRAAHCEARSGP